MSTAIEDALVAVRQIQERVGLLLAHELPVCLGSRGDYGCRIEGKTFIYVETERPGQKHPCTNVLKYWPYQKEPDFRPIWADVSGLIRQNVPSLSAVTLATLAYLLETMTAVSGGSIPLLIAGSSIETASSERTQRLVEICADQQLTHLILGRDAVACHDCDLLRASGLVLVQHVYQGPTARAPRPGVTVLHDVFRLGRAEVAQRLTNDWSLEPITGRLD